MHSEEQVLQKGLDRRVLTSRSKRGTARVCHPTGLDEPSANYGNCERQENLTDYGATGLRQAAVSGSALLNWKSKSGSAGTKRGGTQATSKSSHDRESV